MAIPLSNTLDQLTAADIAAVIGWPETSTLEFKADLPAKDGRDPWHAGKAFGHYARDKLFKEVVALANTSGGHLLLGVAETKDAAPTAERVAPISRCRELAERLARAASDTIDPQIPLLQVVGIPTEPDGSGVVVFRVPASRAAPHRAPDLHCYVRRGANSEHLSMREIQHLTLASGRRQDAHDHWFTQARGAFTEWLRPRYDSRTWAGLRISLTPTMAQFNLPRLFGRLPIEPKDQFPIRFNGSGQRAIAANPPVAQRPILRGVRLEDRSDEHNQAYLAMYGDGSVDCGVRHPPADDLRLGYHLYLPQILGHFFNAIRAAHALRIMGGDADSEYAVEIELAAPPPEGLAILCWGQSWFGKVSTPLLLPRLSFGPVLEVARLASLVVNDLSDAAGRLERSELLIDVDPAAVFG